MVNVGEDMIYGSYGYRYSFIWQTTCLAPCNSTFWVFGYMEPGVILNGYTVLSCEMFIVCLDAQSSCRGWESVAEWKSQFGFRRKAYHWGWLCVRITGQREKWRPVFIEKSSNRSTKCHTAGLHPVTSRHTFLYLTNLARVRIPDLHVETACVAFDHWHSATMPNDVTQAVLLTISRAVNW